MDIALWIVAGLLALAFLGAGFMKSTRSSDKLAAAGMAWVEDFSPGVVRFIGISEVLGAIGLVLPPLVGVAPILAPIAAAALAVVMAGAVVTHLRRKEYGAIVPSLVLLLLSAFVAWGRFGPYAF
jgi:uncharacterized membrane protein YphA (DoxX/SURF4 family)